MRYARYPGGQKYEDGGGARPEEWADHDKREAALVYEVWWKKVEDDEEYQRAKEEHREAWVSRGPRKSRGRASIDSV